MTSSEDYELQEKISNELDNLSLDVETRPSPEGGTEVTIKLMYNRGHWHRPDRWEITSCTFTVNDEKE